MAFDISTVTFKGSELFAAATAADKLIVSGCDAFVAAYTLAQAQAVTARVSSPMTTSTDVTLVGSGNNHIMLRAIFEAGITSGGLAKTLMIFGHKQSDPDNDFVLCVVSSNDGFNLPLTTDAISTFETLFDVEYVVPGDSVATATTAVFATLAEFNDLKSRAVLCHNYGDSTHGPDQNVYGSKRFMNSTFFYDEVSAYTKEEDENETGRFMTWLSCYTPTGHDHPVYEYYARLSVEGAGCAFIEVASRDSSVNGANDDGSGLLTFHCKKCKFDSQSVNVDAQLNVKKKIKFDNFSNDTYATLAAVQDSVNGGGLIEISNADNLGHPVNEIIVGNDGVNPPYFEVSTSDIRFVKHPDSTVSDSDLTFSIGPFNTETFGEVHLYNLASNARRAYGFNRMGSSFQGQLIRYQIGLKNEDDDTSLGLINIQHRDTWDKAIIDIQGSQVRFDCDNLYPSSTEGVDTYIGSSSTPFKRGYFGILYSTDALIDDIETNRIFNELGLRIEWGESRNAFIKMEPIDSDNDKITISANKIYLTAEAGTTGSSVSINPTLYINVLNSSGSATFNNYVNFENEVRVNSGSGVKIRGSLVPADDISFSLGTSSYRWALANIQAITCDVIRADDLIGRIPSSGNGTSSNIMLKKGTIGLFFIANSVFSSLGITTAVPGRTMSFSNAGNNKISFATNDGTGFKKSSGTIYAGTVYITLLSEVVVNQNDNDSIALCLVTEDQG